MNTYLPNSKLMWMWREITGDEPELLKKQKEEKTIKVKEEQDKKDTEYFKIKKQIEENTKIKRLEVNQRKNVGLERQKEKLQKNKLSKESSSIVGSQDWVNLRAPDKKENTAYAVHTFPFPGIGTLFNDQHLSYAILLDSHTVRLSGGHTIKVNARTKSFKGNNFPASCTGQNVTHALNDARAQRIRDTQNSEIPEQVTMDDLIRGRVIICAISNMDQMLGRNEDSKISHTIFWLAKSQNAHLLALTGVLNDLVITGLDFNDDDEFDDFGFSFEREENIVKGETPVDRLIYLLSSPNILRNNFKELSGTKIEETITRKDSESSYDSGIIYEDQNQEETNLMHFLLSEKGKTTCELWMSLCKNFKSDNCKEFVEYIFSFEGSDDLDMLLNLDNE